MIFGSMGNIFGRLIRPLKNYNVENRAHRVLDSKKPIVAPKHPTTIKIQQTQAETESAPEEKNSDLDERLKQVYVVSTDQKPSDPEKGHSGARKLPQNRSTPEESMFGPDEPARIPQGKLTIRQTLELLARFQSEPEKWTLDELGKEYKLDAKSMVDLTTYYMAFNLYIPSTRKDEKSMPKILRPDPKRLIQTLVVPSIEIGDGSGQKRFLDKWGPLPDKAPPPDKS